ncbi:MAG: tetratricopeptide repeat protein [Hyphomicrobiaceae bacterium]|nr:tetratricopeptide repeat protein [Hyphomicrobiaceae bacterium]MCC0024978.1 tetratricopeptide repeat protein [Hyphomicrobiaceae bacterium]
MIRLLVYLLISLALSAALVFLFNTEGSVLIEFGTWRLQPSLGTAAVTLLFAIVLAMLVWGLLRRLYKTPSAIARASRRANERRAVEALSNGFIALESGDSQKARQLAREARTRQPGNLAAHLLEARAALNLGEWSEARDEYKTLLDNSETALPALMGLYRQAEAQNRPDAALTFAQKALAIAPQAAWASKAVLDDLTRHEHWAEALELVIAGGAGTKDERNARIRQQVVLNTAIAAEKEEKDPAAALAATQAALRLDANFVPAALISGRILSSRGEVRKASSLLKRVWQATRHPHIATLYAYAQPGVSPAQRLARLGELMAAVPDDPASAVVMAQAAVEASEWPKARNALAAFATTKPTRDMCLLMAEIEEGQNHDHGRAREWLARAATAPADPVWTADGMTFDEWRPASPVSGRLDALEWKVPLTMPAPVTATRPVDPPKEPAAGPDANGAAKALPGDNAKPVN